MVRRNQHVSENRNGPCRLEHLQTAITLSTQQLAAMYDEIEAVKSELHHIKATITKSISETVVSVDGLEAKHDMFENQVEENFSLIHSRLNKLRRTLVQQVSTLTLKVFHSSFILL